MSIAREQDEYTNRSIVTMEYYTAVKNDLPFTQNTDDSQTRCKAYKEYKLQFHFKLKTSEVALRQV